MGDGIKKVELDTGLLLVEGQGRDDKRKVGLNQAKIVDQ